MSHPAAAFGLSIDPELSGRVRLGLLLLDGVTVNQSDPALAAEIEARVRELRTRHAGVKSGDVPGTEDARTLYKALGLDPTKTRPSNEAYGCPRPCRFISSLLTTTTGRVLAIRWSSARRRAAEIAVDRIRTISKQRLGKRLDGLDRPKAAQVRRLITEMYGE